MNKAFPVQPNESGIAWFIQLYFCQSAYWQYVDRTLGIFPQYVGGAFISHSRLDQNIMYLYQLQTGPSYNMLTINFPFTWDSKADSLFMEGLGENDVWQFVMDGGFQCSKQ